MRVIARRTLVAFYAAHPETEASVTRWYTLVKQATWGSMHDIQAAFPRAKVLDGERVRFELAGGNYRLIVAFDFRKQIAFVKFVGTHSEYDRVDALTVSQF
jgi:mRNA interferase HigB